MRRYRNKFPSPELRLFQKNHERFLILAEKCREDSTISVEEIIELLELFQKQGTLLQEQMAKFK